MSETLWDWKGKYLLPVAATITSTLILSLAVYLTGGWDKLFAFFGQPVTVPLIGFVLLLAGWLLLAATAAVIAGKYIGRADRRLAGIVVDGVLWRWGENVTQQGMTPFCAECDLQLVEVELPSSYEAAGYPGFCLRCEMCNKTIRTYPERKPQEVRDLIARMVQQSLRRLRGILPPRRR